MFYFLFWAAILLILIIGPMEVQKPTTIYQSDWTGSFHYKIWNICLSKQKMTLEDSETEKLANLSPIESNTWLWCISVVKQFTQSMPYHYVKLQCDFQSYLAKTWGIRAQYWAKTMVLVHFCQFCWKSALTFWTFHRECSERLFHARCWISKGVP